MGIPEFIIGRAFARPVGSTHPCTSQKLPPMGIAAALDRSVDIE
jgi:hypothetical protein